MPVGDSIGADQDLTVQDWMLTTGKPTNGSRLLEGKGWNMKINQIQPEYSFRNSLHWVDFYRVDYHITRLSQGSHPPLMGWAFVQQKMHLNGKHILLLQLHPKVPAPL